MFTFLSDKLRKLCSQPDELSSWAVLVSFTSSLFAKSVQEKKFDHATLNHLLQRAWCLLLSTERNHLPQLRTTKSAQYEIETARVTQNYPWQMCDQSGILPGPMIHVLRLLSWSCFHEGTAGSLQIGRKKIRLYDLDLLASRTKPRMRCNHGGHSLRHPSAITFPADGASNYQSLALIYTFQLHLKR